MNSTHLSTRRLRLASGLVLLFYVFTHLLNHSLGLVSLAAAEAGRHVFIAFWRSLPVTAVFYGALLLHFGLALHALVQRRSLVMPASEAVRLVLGFLIPFLLAQHFSQTRVVHELYDIDDSYRRNVTAMWNGGSTLKQMLLITVAWLHGCLGIHLAFRHRAGYRQWQTTFVVLATVLAVLAATGYLAMARELSYEVPWMDGLDASQMGVLQRTGELIAQVIPALAEMTLERNQARLWISSM